nr:uncharacterized protein LOC101885829 isoform X5 [Danio rerio]|eukprot:XP_021322643.1 uncharacterized protein LOC101885829 isoform X5 [Danio rerio]
MKVDCKSCSESRSINTSSKTVERFQKMSTRPFEILAEMESCKTLTVGGRGVKRKAEDDFHSILGEGKPYALRKRIRVAELENTRDTEMSSYQEKTSSGGRGVKRKADDDFHSVLGEGKPYALRKRIKVAELENTRVDADTEASSSGGRGVKRKADDDFHSVLGEGKPYALRKRIRAAETSSDENSSSGQSPVTESHFSTVSSLKIHNTEASCKVF